MAINPVRISSNVTTNSTSATIRTRENLGVAGVGSKNEVEVRQVGISGRNGTDGADGTDGVAGAGSDKNYYHIQSVASNQWVIPHSLGKFPIITVVDDVGNVVIGDIIYTDLNNITLNLSKAITGKAYLN